MEMDVPLLIHNLALWGTNTRKTNRRGGKECVSLKDLRAFNTFTGHDNTVQGQFDLNSRGELASWLTLISGSL